MLKKKSNIRLKAVVLAVIIILASYINILSLTRGATDLSNFRCDGEKIDINRYRADVNEVINFSFARQDAIDIWAIMGDENVIWSISGTSFSYNYSMEGIHNITLWATGMGMDSEWLIIEIINDAPEFDIGISNLGYYNGTYDFEDDELGETPYDWTIYDNDVGFYLLEYTTLIEGRNVSGSYEDLKSEDSSTWTVRSDYWPYSVIIIDLALPELFHEFVPGKFKFYFSANESMIFRESVDLDIDRKIFEGSYSNGEIISITSPYLELIATFNDLFHRIEIDWFKLVAIDNGLEIIEDVNDHGKIAKISLLNSTVLCGIQQSFSSQLYGTIELWYETTNISIGARIFSQSGYFNIIQKNNDWFAGTNNITAEVDIHPLEYTWYHIRIDWRDIGAPPYQSLSQGYYRVHINGNSSSAYSLSAGGSGINSLSIETNGTIFIDAIGYTWEDYNIGDNLIAISPEHIYEECEITFNLINLKESEIDKVGFSYNSENQIGENYTYIWDFGDGNFSYAESPTYLFSKAGEYPVRLTLIDDQGAMTTKVRNIIIENKEPEASIWSGVNYDSTYDFKLDLSDNPPAGWYTYGNIKVTNFKDKFSKVVEIDTRAGGVGMMSLSESLSQFHPALEFWVYFSDINEDRFFFWIGNSLGGPFDAETTRFGLFDGVWKYYYEWEDPVYGIQYDYAEISELDAPKSNEWIHIRFEIEDYPVDKWRIQIDGKSSNFYNSINGSFWFQQLGLKVEPSSHIYLDSFGFESDPEYNLGDNNPVQLNTYYGSWDFRFYPNGPIPYDQTLELSTLGPWTFTSYSFEQIASGCSANIISELDSHHKVLELQDNNDEDLIIASLLDVSKPTHGTIEFWLRTTDISQGLVMAFGHEVFQSGIWVSSDGRWLYRNGDQELEISDVPAMQDNTWHHIRIDFDCRKGGSYLGLQKNQFYFWVDQVISTFGPFEFSHDVSNFMWNIWSTKEEGNNYSIYLDAVGTSWDPAYEIGANLNPREGIYSDTELIFYADCFDTPSDKDNLRYFWDFGDNQTAFGEMLLHSYGRPGKYKVQLIAMDDNGLYDVAEKYLWIDNLYPEIEVYKYSYGVSYDFTNDKVGDFPSGWYPSPFEDMFGRITEVVSEVDGYLKPVLIGMGPAFGGMWTANISGLPMALSPGDLNITHGTVEFWLYTTDTSESVINVNLFGRDSNSGIMLTYGANNKFWEQRDYTPPASYIEIEFENSWIFQNNTWTHFRIDFSCDNSFYMGLENDTFVVYADGHGSQILNMRDPSGKDITNITCVGFFTANPSLNEYSAQVFVDNIGFSWDPNYNVGANLLLNKSIEFNEGETIILDCMSYDTYLDYMQLSYYWGDSSTNIAEWQEMGWEHSYLFTNGFDENHLGSTTLISFVRDPLYIWDVDSYQMKIVNILPSLNIHTAKINSNISTSIYHEGTEGTNFTIYLKADDENEAILHADYPSGFPQNWISGNSSHFTMDLSKTWTIVVNQTGREGGEHLFVLTFSFENGYEINKTFNFDGITDIWTFEINPLLINSLNSLSNVPITFEFTISDPSNDMIHLSIDNIFSTVYEIPYVGHTFTKYYTIAHEPNDIICKFEIFEKDGIPYAIIEFREPIQNEWNDELTSRTFPVNYEFEFNADMTDIDIYNFIDYVFNDNDISPLGIQVQVNHFISADYYEIDPISETQHLNLNYNITSQYEFENLAPSITIHAPVNMNEDQNHLYTVDVKDFNSDNVFVSFSFGLNNGSGLNQYAGTFLGDNRFGVNYSYSSAGKYLITVKASDGVTISKALHLIEVINQLPYAKIRTFQNITFEDKLIKFEADIHDTESDLDSLRFYWDFGDGVFSAETSPSHAFSSAGDYTINLVVKDDNGGVFYATHTIKVIDRPPEILGPFSFKGIEGQWMTLDVDVSDSFSDNIMSYTWDIYKANRIYNGTYNFMNIDEGDVPSFPFEYLPASDIDYQVINDVAGHTKVLAIEDNNNDTGGHWNLKFGDTLSVNGTIEFWLRSSYIASNKENFAIQMLEYGSLMIPIIISDNGTWMYSNLFENNHTAIPNLPKLISNTWHHVRIDYECSDGGYLSLGEDQWRIIIDGISSPDLNLQFDDIPPNDNADYLDSLRLVSGNPANMSIFCDAIGYHDGSSLYQIGDNLNPVLISYDYVKTLYGKDPTLTLDDGTYLVNMTVENDLTSRATITLDIVNIAPLVTVPSKRYNGHPGDIAITAYAWDSIIDWDNLEFEWFIGSERVFIESGTVSSTINVFCNSTGIIKGHVSVRDSSDSTTTTDFSIRVFIDKNGDGISNEYENLFKINKIDQDNDNLPNFYEINYFGTLYDVWDTDNDGLCDGWDNATLSGELVIGTNATDPDTDDDGLLDGFEWFGWNKTFYTQKGQITIHYTSDPLEFDSDLDGLNDYDEYIYNTNPISPDTDNDALTDYEEIFKYFSSPTNPDCDDDGLLDGLEFKLGTHFDNPDTDGDGIQDGPEYYGWDKFWTNPLSKDSDHDFLSDSSEIIPYSFKINGRKNVENPVILEFELSGVEKAESASLSFLLAYEQTTPNESLSDVRVQIFKYDTELIFFNEEIKLNGSERYISKLIDIKDVIEGASESYYGDYVLKVEYINENHGELCLEEYGIDVVRYLDPTNDDYDNDGIIDGVETQLLVEGTEIIELAELVNITADTNSTTFEVYPFEISDIGRMYNANISFVIISNETLDGSGNVLVKLLKKELDCTKNDITLLTSTIPFSTSEDFSETYFKDLSGYFPENYYGTFNIIIDIYDDADTDVFILTNVTIETSGYRDATSSDTEAWITKPDLPDTDDDGWSDSYEIYDRNEPTNPLAWDTDGDGIKDSIDIDPLHNIFIQVNFLKGSIHDLENWYVEQKNPPYLQMTVDFSYQGTTVAFASPQTSCTQDLRSIIYWFLGIVNSFEWRPRLGYYTTAMFGHSYTFDIEDDISELHLNIKLWDEFIGKTDEYGDNLLISQTYTHNLKTAEVDKPIAISGSSGGNSFNAEVITRKLNHTNIIAIYDNSTIFNGHYNNHDRMHVIQLTITDTPSENSPFVLGSNAILIPNEILMNTELNIIIQNDTIQNSVLANGEFITLDKFNLPDTASNNIEAVFALECIFIEAKEILNLILTGIINETTGETAVINLYASTKLDNFRAEMMNLHPDVLRTIPLVNPYQNSPTGSMPTEREDRPWWADVLEKGWEALVGFFIGLLEPFITLLIIIVEALVDILFIIIQIVILLRFDLIGALVLSALLLPAYLVFPLTLLLIVKSFLKMAAIAYVFSTLRGLTLTITDHSFTIQGAITFSYEFKVELWQVPFYEIEIPNVRETFTFGNVIHNRDNHYFIKILPELFVFFQPNLLDALNSCVLDPILPEGTSQDFIAGVADMLTVIGVGMSIAGSILILTPDISKIIKYKGIELTALGVMIFIMLDLIASFNAGHLTANYLRGLLLGGRIASVFNEIIMLFNSPIFQIDFSKYKIMRNVFLRLSTGYSLIKLLGNYLLPVFDGIGGEGHLLEGAFNTEDLVKVLEVIGGFVAMGLGTALLLSSPELSARTDAATTFSKISIMIPFIIYLNFCIY